MLFRDGHVRRAHLNRVRTPGLLDDLGLGDDDATLPPGNGGNNGPADPGVSTSSPQASPSPSKPLSTASSHSSTVTSTSTQTPKQTPSPSASASVSESKTTAPNASASNSQPSNTVSNDQAAQASNSNPLNNGAVNTDTDATPSAGYSTGNSNPLLPTTTSQSSATDTNTDDHSTIKYIGYAAGAVLGFAVLVAGIMFIMRRIAKRKEQESLGDVFDQHSFVRESVAIPDHVDNDDGDRSRPRPPTMIDRRMRAANNGSPDYSGFGGAPAPPLPGHGSEEGYYGGNNGAYGNAYGQQGGYDQYNQYNAGYGNGYDNQYDQYGQYGAPQPGYGYHDSPAQSPMVDHFSEHPGQNVNYLNHQVGGPEYPTLPAPAAVAGSPTQENSRSLTRQPSSKAPAVVYPNVAELGRGTSVTPYQATQYAEISKRLDDPNTAHANNSGQAYAQLDRHGQPAAAQRPDSEYKDDDAYGGI